MPPPNVPPPRSGTLGWPANPTRFAPMRSFRAATTFGLIAALSLLAGGAIFAQTAKQDSVAKRPRSEFNAIGIENEALGSFVLRPKVTTTVTHDDNIFRTETETDADVFVTFLSSLELRSNWDNHSLSLRAQSTNGRYNELDNEAFDDFQFSGRGRVDASERFSANLAVTFERKHEGRGSPDDEGGAKPTIFFVTTGGLGAKYDGGTVDIVANLKNKRLDYRDNGTANNDDRDRDEVTLKIRTSYEAVPGSKFYFEPSVNRKIYKDDFDDSGVDRDSSGWRLLLGTTLDISAVTFLELGVGYMQQRFEEVSLDTASGFSFEGEAVWNATDLTTLTLSGSRTVEQTTTSGASSYLATKGSIRVDHELLYNLLLDAGGSIKGDRYVGIDRSDDNWQAFFGASYLMNEYFDLRAAYKFNGRRSSEPATDYDDNQFSLRLVGKI